MGWISCKKTANHDFGKILRFWFFWILIAIPVLVRFGLDTLLFRSESTFQTGLFTHLKKGTKREYLIIWNKLCNNLPNLIQRLCVLIIASSYLFSNNITFSASLPSEMVAPRIQMEHEINVDIQDGDTVTFVCKVEGNPEPRLLFFKDEKRLRSNENISIGKIVLWHREMAISQNLFMSDPMWVKPEFVCLVSQKCTLWWLHFNHFKSTLKSQQQSSWLAFFPLFRMWRRRSKLDTSITKLWPQTNGQISCPC